MCWSRMGDKWKCGGVSVFCLPVCWFVCLEWPHSGCIRISHPAEAGQRNDSIHDSKEKNCNRKLMLEMSVTLLVILERSVMDDDDFDGIFMLLRPVESTLHKNMWDHWGRIGRCWERCEFCWEFHLCVYVWRLTFYNHTHTETTVFCSYNDQAIPAWYHLKKVFVALEDKEDELLYCLPHFLRCVFGLLISTGLIN